jgi:hypothetical protein
MADKPFSSIFPVLAGLENLAGFPAGQRILLQGMRAECRLFSRSGTNAMLIRT